MPLSYITRCNYIKKTDKNGSKKIVWLRPCWFGALLLHWRIHRNLLDYHGWRKGIIRFVLCVLPGMIRLLFMSVWKWDRLLSITDIWMSVVFYWKRMVSFGEWIWEEKNTTDWRREALICGIRARILNVGMFTVIIILPITHYHLIINIRM